METKDRTILGAFVAPLLVGIGSYLLWSAGIGLLAAGGAIMLMVLLCPGPRGKK